ncbi:unnamed protein product, partial [Owenia fusiformis]
PVIDNENYKSATNPNIVKKVAKQIREEIENDRYIITKSIPNLISSIGAIPKAGSEEPRIIHDASRPLGKGLNSLATPRPFKFEGFDQAVKLVKPGNYMCKVDLRWGYRHVPTSDNRIKPLV